MADAEEHRIDLILPKKKRISYKSDENKAFSVIFSSKIEHLSASGDVHVTIYYRRGGPGLREGLRKPDLGYIYAEFYRDGIHWSVKSIRQAQILDMMVMTDDDETLRSLIATFKAEGRKK